MSLQAMQTISSWCKICGHVLIFIAFTNYCYLLRYKQSIYYFLNMTYEKPFSCF